MEEETSLLEQVRTKELELKEQEERARTEAQAIISDAQRRSHEMVEAARREGDSLAEKRYLQGMDELETSKQALRSEADVHRRETSKRGESRIAEAAGRIIEKIAFE